LIVIGSYFIYRRIKKDIEKREERQLPERTEAIAWMMIIIGVFGFALIGLPDVVGNFKEVGMSPLLATRTIEFLTITTLFLLPSFLILKKKKIGWGFFVVLNSLILIMVFGSFLSYLFNKSSFEFLFIPIKYLYYIPDSRNIVPLYCVFVTGGSPYLGVILISIFLKIILSDRKEFFKIAS